MDPNQTNNNIGELAIDTTEVIDETMQLHYVTSSNAREA